MDPPAAINAGVFQVAIVVRDLDRAIEVATNMLGAGPFQTIESTTRKVYRGKPIEPVHRIAGGSWGPVVLELIQPVSGESVYTEFLGRHGQGVHHLGVAIDSWPGYQAALEHLARAGFPTAQSGRREDLAYDYVDTEPALGTFLELIFRGRPGDQA